MHSPKFVQLGAFTLDTVRGTLRGPAGTVGLRRKTLEVLLHLIEHADRVITKEELFAAVWPDVTVGDDSLAQCISEIRRALGPDGREVIKTVPRRGYLLNVAAEPFEASGPKQETAARAPEVQRRPDRPSVAVLPFTSFDGEPDQTYFGNGIAEDIITELSRFSELFVIARNSSFQYQDRQVDVRQIGRELEVRYVLEGSVRRAADNVRITAQLVDTVNGMHRWAERYDRKLDDALGVQDEVACAIVSALAVQVNKAERERVLLKPPSVWQAYDFYLRAAECEAHYHSSYDKASLKAARRLLEQALANDPDYARAHAALSNVYMSLWVHRLDDDDVAWSDALDRCYQSAREGVRLAPDLPEAHIALGQALTFKRQHEAALAAVERAIVLNPNLTSFRFSYILVLAGEPARAVQLLEAHMRLDPFYQPNASVAFGYACYMLKRYDAGLPHLQEAVSRAPNMAHCRYVLATTYAQLGRAGEAKVEVAHALRLEPWYRIRHSLTAQYFRFPEDREHLLDGLRKAGFPE